MVGVEREPLTSRKCVGNAITSSVGVQLSLGEGALYESAFGVLRQNSESYTRLVR